MDALLKDLQIVCGQLLPIIGAVALIFVCILVKKAWALVDEITETVKKLDPTIHLANQSMEKIQAPLDTAVKVSSTVDTISDKANESAGKISEAVASGMDSLSTFMTEKFNHNETDIPDMPVYSEEKENETHE